MTKVIAIVNGKGGVGKTLLTTNLAAVMQRIGVLSTIIDRDPQPNSYLWSLDRAKNEIQPPVAAIEARTVAEVERRIAEARRQDADLIFIDTMPRLDEDAPKIVQLADAVLVPLKPEPFFVKALPQTMKLLTASGKPHFVVLTSVELQGPEHAEVEAGLQASNTPLAPCVLHRRKAFWNRAHQGVTAADYDQDGKAAAELLRLALWLVGIVGLSTNIQKYKSILDAAERTTRILRQLRELSDEDTNEASADNLRNNAGNKRRAAAG
jgi:chromosome partitioning protein